MNIGARPAAVTAPVGRFRCLVQALEVLAPVALFGLVLVFRGSASFRTLVGEDGVLEWAQVAAFAVAAWALLSGAIRTTGSARLAFAVCGCAVVVVIGEEIAWGTRLIGSGVGFIEVRNEQGDTTIHNLGGALEVSFLGIVATALVLCGLVAARWAPLRDVPGIVVWWLLVPAAYAAYRVLDDDVPYHIAKLSEAAELVFALALARLAFAARERSLLTNSLVRQTAT